MIRFSQSVLGLAALLIVVVAVGALAGRDARAQIPFFAVCGEAQVAAL